MNEKIRMIKALESFNKAYLDLLIEWSGFDSIELNELKSIELYPFKQSFDELNITEWITTTIDELNITE